MRHIYGRDGEETLMRSRAHIAAVSAGVAGMVRYGKRAHLIVHEQERFNAETGLAALAEGLLSATDAFYRARARRGSGARPGRVARAVVGWEVLAVLTVLLVP
jgi:hypothetical protein